MSTTLRRVDVRNILGCIRGQGGMSISDFYERMLADVDEDQHATFTIVARKKLPYDHKAKLLYSDQSGSRPRRITLPSRQLILSHISWGGILLTDLSDASQSPPQAPFRIRRLGEKGWIVDLLSGWTSGSEPLIHKGLLRGTCKRFWAQTS